MNDTEKRRPWGSVVKKKGSRNWSVRYPDPSRPRTACGRPSYTTMVIGPSKVKARQVLEDLHRHHLAGRLGSVAEAEEPQDGLTLLAAIDEYIAAKEAEGRAAGTIAGYKGKRVLIAASPLSSRTVSDLTPRDVEVYRAWRRERVWRAETGQGGERRGKRTLVRVPGATPSNATINRDLAVISAALNRLVRLGIIDSNSATRVRRAREERRSRAMLSKGEVRRLVLACDDWLRPLVLAAVLTGARRGELTRLRWGDVSLETASVRLYRSKVHGGGTIPLHPVLAEELRLLREERIRRERRIVRDDEHVFLGPTGRRVGQFRGAWAQALERAGLGDREGITFHCLRHTFSCHYLEGGAAITDLQGILGHASVTTTMIYARMIDARARASVQALDFGLGGGKNGEKKSTGESTSPDFESPSGASRTRRTGA